MFPFILLPFLNVAEATGTGSSLAGFLSNIGTVLTSMVGWLGSVGQTVVETPALLVPFAIGIAMTGVALFKSLSH